MNPLLYLWMYESWIQDLREDNESKRTYAILTGSFANMELAKKMIDKENPTFQSSDEDFEETYRMIEEDVANKESKTRRRAKKRKRYGVMNG